MLPPRHEILVLFIGWIRHCVVFHNGSTVTTVSTADRGGPPTAANDPKMINGSNGSKLTKRHLLAFQQPHVV